MHNIHLYLVVYKGGGGGESSIPRDTPPYPFLQYTVEKLGKADSVTELDTELEELSQQLEHIRFSTERILAQVQSLVIPNPGRTADTHNLMHVTKARTHSFLTCLRPPH